MVLVNPRLQSVVFVTPRLQCGTYTPRSQSVVLVSPRLQSVVLVTHMLECDTCNS